MITVFKYQLELKEIQEVDMLAGAEILCVQLQQGMFPMLWVRGDDDSGNESRRIAMVGTGNAAPSWQDGRYIGTVQLNGYVWHFFEERTEDVLHYHKVSS